MDGKDLPLLVCDYCHDFITKFHVFYEFVRENQERLELESCQIKEEVVSEATSVIAPVKLKKRKNAPSIKKNQLNLKQSVIKELKNGATLNPSLGLAPSNLYLCDHCDKYYSLHPKQILNHIRKCKDKKSFRKVPTQDELIVSCPLCPPHALKLKNDRVLELHLGEHSNFDRIDKSRVKAGQTPLIPCPNCERRFASTGEYLSHLKIHEKDAFMTCELCGRTTVAANLSAHLQNHFKKFCCEFCSLACKSQYDLQKHINRRHSGPQFFECFYCNLRIKRKVRLEKHLKNCRGPGTVWPCPHCGETFNGNNERKRHIRHRHIGFRCRICGIEFENVSSLNRHMKGEEHKTRSVEKRLARARAKTGQVQKSKSTSKFLI